VIERTVPATAHRGRTAALHFARIASGYWRGPGRWSAWLLTVGLVTLTVVQVLLAVRFNLWSADLFDALERLETREVLFQSGVFAGIVVATMVSNAAHLEVRRRLEIGWRQWLTSRLVEGWMATGRQHQLDLVPGTHSNPDARIAEDVRLVTEAIPDLAHSLLYCLLLLVGFVSILWGLSGLVPIALGSLSFELPGYFVWLALVYSGAGALVALLLGRTLVPATDQRQTAEADFRFQLVRDREKAESIALMRGEANERKRLAGLFVSIREAWRRQTASLRGLMLFSSAYTTLATMFPILVAAPRYLAGDMTLGGLMQTAQAFQQLTAALSWPIDNFPRLAETMASIERVMALEDAIATMDEEVRHPDITIAVEPTRGTSLSFHELTIALPGGRILFSEISTEIAPGERVMILGDPQLARTLFKVVAGAWPWGRGRVDLPDDADIHFLPRDLHLPIDTLRAALAYPDEPDSVDPGACVRAIERVGLPSLAARLDAVDDWGRVLDASDLQRLGFARILVKRPRWVFLEEPGAALGFEAERALLELLVEELPEATLLTATHHVEHEAFYHRTLRLEPAADGRVFVRDSGPRAPPQALLHPGWRAIELIRKGLGESDG